MNVEPGTTAPLARGKGLVVKELPDEVLVYDLSRDEAHCLNRSAALVWKSCDGHSTPAEIARRVSAELGEPVGEDTVWRALGQLHNDHLLEEAAGEPAGRPSVSRRRMILTLGAAVATVPVITSLAAPAAYAAGSCGSTCTDPNQCSHKNCSTCKDNNGNVCNNGSCTGRCQ